MPALPSAITPASTVTPAPVASHATNEVDEEVRLVGLAYSLLRDGAPARALAVLEEHERRFPNGRLVESRRVTRILALCQSGRTAEAQAERDRFLSLYPRSPFSNRVRTACGSTPAP
jgi:outer membrane protein assembly factor BamD (BamD/ComL family)